MAIKAPLDHIRPRPVRRLPDLAPANARRRTAELLENRGLSAETAQAIADAIVDQGAARSHIASPERRRVPGGELLVIRADAWARRLGPDPANMRTGPDRVHPFAVAPGSGGENSRFSPVQPATSDPNGRPELVAEVESREHMEWQHLRAADYVMKVNDWADSIAVQGVMEEVWVVGTTYHHGDGTPPRVVCQTAEGSSRTTACHRNLEVNTTNDLYDLKDATLRAQINRFNDQIDMGTLSEGDERAVRSFIVPALFIIGFEPAESVDTPPFHVAVASLVALRHVDRPEPWGAASEMEALADGVLDECERRRIIKPDERRWLAGSMTREEASRRRFSDDPAIRAVKIIELFCSTDPKVQLAIRAAVTAQSTRRQIRTKLKNEMAVALVLRAVADAARHRERIRKYMNEAIAQDWHRRSWDATQRSVSELERLALAEIADMEKPGDEPGPASIELAARAMYTLVTNLQLHGDRGTANNTQADHRTPGGVLDTMRRSAHGVRQLSQAARDGQEGLLKARAVDPAGALVHDGLKIKLVTDDELRTTFPQDGKPTKAAGPADTPQKKLNHAIAELASTVEALAAATGVVGAVRGHGGPVVNEMGVSPNHVEAWVKTLDNVRECLQRWKWIAESRQPTAEEPDEGDRLSALAALDDDALADLAADAGITTSATADREELIDLLMEAGIRPSVGDASADEVDDEDEEHTARGVA
jgi:hypothetical protein